MLTVESNGLLFKSELQITKSYHNKSFYQEQCRNGLQFYTAAVQ